MKNKALDFTFFPTAFVSNFTPLLVTLQTPLNAEPILSEYKMWNILSLRVDALESNQPYTEIEVLIEEFALECECDEYLYLYVADDAFVSEELIKKLCDKGYKTLFYNYTPDAFGGEKKELRALLDLLEKEGV